MLPFTRDQFFAIFVGYNAGIWPAQVVANVIGLGMVVALLRASPFASRVIAAGVAAMWIWTGFVYHGLYFSGINKAATVFAGLFIVQGVALLFAGVVEGRLSFDRRQRQRFDWLGWAFVGYAAILYPIIGLWTGHRIDELPMFGVTPCPVTIFTFGLLLLASSPVPWWLLVVPLIWSLVGGSAAFLLGVPQDWLLLVSGLSVLAIVRGGARACTPRRPRSPAPAATQDGMDRRSPVVQR